MWTSGAGSFFKGKSSKWRKSAGPGGGPHFQLTVDPQHISLPCLNNSKRMFFVCLTTYYSIISYIYIYPHYFWTYVGVYKQQNKNPRKSEAEVLANHGAIMTGKPSSSGLIGGSIKCSCLSMAGSYSYKHKRWSRIVEFRKMARTLAGG